MHKVLLTWYGLTDLRASLGLEESTGPVLGALLADDYTSVFILGFTNPKKLENGNSGFQEKIKNIQAEGTSGSNSVKVILNGENEMIKINLSDEVMKEDKVIIEDLIVAAHNNAKSELKSKTSEELSKSTSGFDIPGFKWPL